MKISGKDLGSLIREVVGDELQKLLPKMIEKHLTESYIRKIVLESAGRRGISELMQGDGEEIEVTPEAMDNSDDGIYEEPPLMKGKRQQTNESISKLLSKDNPLSFIYEGVSPVPMNDTLHAGMSTPDVPLDAFGDDFMKRMTKLAPRVVEQDQAKKTSLEEKMRELEEKRKRLDVRVPVVKG